MLHWHVSSCAGFLLTGQYRPVCSIIWGLSDCRPRTAFARCMNATFCEDRHCGRIHDTWLIGRLLRGHFPSQEIHIRWQAMQPRTGERPKAGY